jgi:hypothetical protein
LTAALNVGITSEVVHPILIFVALTPDSHQHAKHPQEQEHRTSSAPETTSTKRNKRDQRQLKTQQNK